jgi:hypothetical protein
MEAVVANAELRLAYGGYSLLSSPLRDQDGHYSALRYNLQHAQKSWLQIQRLRLALRLFSMLISQLSLETHSISGGFDCKCRVEVGIWRILITQLSLERPVWALLSSPLNLTTCTKILVANKEAEVGSPLVKDAHYSTILETHNIN